MKAVTYDPTRDEFIVTDIPKPKPADSDVLVKVEACGLNPVDAKIGQWKSMVPHMNDSWVPGLDVSGYIVETGRKVEAWMIGNRVLYHGDMFRPHGGFAEFALQESKTLIPHPALSATVAAATPCSGWTAWRALNDKLRACDRDSILITGGSGGVGGFAIQIAKYLGLKQIIVTCSAQNRDYVKELGATHMIDYRNEDVICRVLEVTNQQGVAIGLDTVGADNDITVANALTHGGHMVELVETVRPASYRDSFMRELSFHQLSLGSGHRSGAKGRETLVAAGRAFSKLVELGHIKVGMVKTIALEEVGPSLVEMLKQRTVGKLVMAI